MTGSKRRRRRDQVEPATGDWTACDYCRAPINGANTVCHQCATEGDDLDDCSYMDDAGISPLYDRLSECSMMADGCCPKAGSEECEFDCGLIHDMDA